MQWTDVLNHYEQLISEGFDFDLQLDIVKKIINSKYVDSLFPTLSHDALIISSVGNFYKSFDYPSICIQYIGDEKFKITYSPNLGQTHNISKLNCNFINVWSYLESLFLKQKLHSDMKENRI